MNIQLGFEIAYQFPQPTPMILALSIHYSRASDLLRPDHLLTKPAVPTTAYRDLFGNWCTRLVAPAGRFVLSTDTVIHDSGALDIVMHASVEIEVPGLGGVRIRYELMTQSCQWFWTATYAELA